MARPLRIQFPGAVYHVISRGNERKPIVRDDDDREKRVDWLQRAVETYGWHLFAFVLMTNHEHLFLKTPEPNLSAGMQYLNGSYTRATSTGATVAPGTYSRADSRGILSRRKATSWKSAGTFT
jgi:REP element-mobilizing transposase RayT